MSKTFFIMFHMFFIQLKLLHQQKCHLLFPHQQYTVFPNYVHYFPPIIHIVDSNFFKSWF